MPKLREPLLVDHIDDPGHFPHLRIRQTGLPKQPRNPRHPPQSLGHPDMLPRDPGCHGAAPGQPMRQRFEIPPIPDRSDRIEFTQQLQQSAYA
jgi:hypothetical protein